MPLLDNPFGMTPQQKPNDVYRMLVFGFVMVALFMAFDTYVQRPQLEALKAQQAASLTPPVPSAPVALPQSRTAVLSAADADGRVALTNPELTASISLTGARLDDLVLKKYYETVEKTENVALLSPSAAENPQLVQFGWLGQDESIAVPNDETRWAVEHKTAQSVSLKWVSPQNVTFEQTITLDDQALFTVEKRVTNNSGKSITVYPYGRVAREGLPPKMQNAAILHEGPIAYVNGKLHEEKFKQLDKDRTLSFDNGNGWIGITEKYWLAAILNPESSQNADFRMIASKGSFERPLYQVDTRGVAETIAPGQTATQTNYAFVGPKKVSLLDAYSKQLNMPHFDLAVDFGKFYFLTRPFFGLLHFLGTTTGSFAIGLLLTSLVIRAFTFPLANTTYRSFAKLRKLAPQMTELKEKYGADRQRMQQELFKFYQKEKVNPAAGCFPILLQIPIFFALYKVLFVTIEMRHAPFVGWIHDMSAPDPTSLFNLFGLIPWNPPAALMIGAWPCIYCLTMLILQRLQPPPADKSQRTMMAVMPFLFTYMLAHFPAGLVIYWSWSNLLSVLQQTIIMKSMGVDVYLFHSDKHKKSDVEILDPKDDVLVQMVESTEVPNEEPKALTPPKRNKKK